MKFCSEEEVVALKGEKIVVDNPEEESFHHISEHDLRNAATMFTLTNWSRQTLQNPPYQIYFSYDAEKAIQIHL